MQKMTYTGEFQKNQMYGQGQLEHHDTHNIFSGQFMNSYKHGPAKFVLAEARQKHGDGKVGIFQGVFEYNLELRQSSDYGPRF